MAKNLPHAELGEARHMNVSEIFIRKLVMTTLLMAALVIFGAFGYANLPAPPTLRKVNPSDSPILYIAMHSDTLPLSQVDTYAETILSRQIPTLSGVAQVNVYGSQKYAVRIQADPSALAARGIGIDQVAAAAQAANVEASTGQLNGPKQSTIIHASGQLTNAAQF